MSKSKVTAPKEADRRKRRRFTEEFKSEAVQMLLALQRTFLFYPGAHRGSLSTSYPSSSRTLRRVFVCDSRAWALRCCQYCRV